MIDPDHAGGRYTIQVSAVPGEDCAGDVALVVVRQAPAMAVVFSAQVAIGGRHWRHRQAALSAAFVEGRRFVQRAMLGLGQS